MSLTLDLPGGLAPARAAGLAELIADIAGPPAATLWLAPTLLFSDPAVQARLQMPVPGADEVLIHDYQAVAHLAPLPLGADLTASAVRADKGPATEFSFDLARSGASVASLKTALRRVVRANLAGLAPTGFAPAQIAAAMARVDGLTITQAHIDAYVALSGDTNPIHRDPDQAAALGLPAPIVPGLLLAGCIQPLAEAQNPAPLAALTCRFMAPLCAGQAVSAALIARGADRMRGLIFAETGAALAVADLRFAG